jgi:predicted ATPase/transcriptional regulator with XRE-family HTH domain
LVEASFGEWLKRQRKAAGLTQEQLAQQLSCSTITLRKIEAEERRPSSQIVERLAEIFNIPSNEQTAFLRFARGDWKSMPSAESEEAPWRLSSVAPRSNLPVSLTSLIGREQEIAGVREYLANPSTRLVTLIGPPGIGKTSLSLEVARKSIHDFADGIFFVPLASLDDPNLIALTIIQVLGFVETKHHQAIEQLKNGIRDKRMLLVMDNLEHIIEDTAPIVSQLLVSCPLLKILATSREALRVPGEWLYPVPTLAVPTETSSVDLEKALQFSALTLFVERARAVQPDFALNADNIKDVVNICNQLDGLPLAIELIAARIRLMSPQFLLSRLSSQFVLSADGMRAVSARQKTLQNAIGWSYRLLSEEEQKLFMRLSVFSSGFTLEAAEAIFSRTVTKRSISNLITSLLDKSLLQRVSNDWGGPRFTMLVTIQQFALDRLRHIDDETEAREWHVTHFLELAERADKEIHGPNQVEWLDRLEIEFSNFRTALDWCISNQKTEIALRLLCALGWAWDVRSHYIEARNWFDKVRILPQIKAYPALYASLLNHLAHHCWMLGNFREGITLLEESRVIWLTLGIEGEQGLAETFRSLGAIAFWGESDKSAAQFYFEQSLEISQKQRDQYGSALSMFYLGRINYSDASALSWFEQGLDTFRQLGDLYHVALIFMHLGWKFRDQGDFQKARSFLTQCLTIHEELKFKEGIAEALLYMGELSSYQGDYDQAEQFYQRSVLLSREYGLKLDESFAYYHLGILSLQRNDYRLAIQYFKDDHRLSHETNEKAKAFDLLYGLAAVAAGLHQSERAAKLYGAMQAIFEKSRYIMPLDRTEFERHIQIARKQLGEAEFESLATEGRAMTMEQAIAYALEQTDQESLD